MMDAKAPPDREERWIVTVGEQHPCPFNPPCRSLRERKSAVRVPISSSLIASSIARRLLAISLLLVQFTANEESASNPPVP
ncbi:hypothetical protein RFM41_30755 [Mesorhizobium sp. VK25A]|uniref:Uncharacterized protein n=1 Tax=Mesorhizobium vachelliae TaxID=3072309 RepID=A0ABU5ADZ0_9HYPH|nr:MULTISPECIES: hypothetical protein [unclassified Mesorhizobium]MDX8535495.1 hypothetical protein [Mesorhizobium sp. VK25D]MDX8548149.1 hypothetical protein [Mesorhizobium sp. VK25A]